MYDQRDEHEDQERDDAQAKSEREHVARDPREGVEQAVDGVVEPGAAQDEPGGVDGEVDGVQHGRVAEEVRRQQHERDRGYAEHELHEPAGEDDAED